METICITLPVWSVWLLTLYIGVGLVCSLGALAMARKHNDSYSATAFVTVLTWWPLVIWDMYR